jgi:hypothetical protein
MSSEGIAVQDRLGDTTDHAMPPGDPEYRVPRPGARGGGPFLYASGSRPLSGYVIKRGVGSGGFGEVYYATSDAGKEVALKLIRRNLDTELRGMRQCLNLKHPNLLSLYDIRQDDAGDTWVVMEYLSGKCLETELADHPQGLPLDQVLVWFHGIAAGVAYLHDHGIVHRDLKPGNIFREEGATMGTWFPKVGDYGLSKFISCSRRSGHTKSIGTVHYMAPEVAHGRYGKELDIYALGAILYELLTGRVPFDGESVGEVLMKHLTALPEVSQLAEPYRSVVGRALEKDPARRFATAGEMAAALPAAAAIPVGGQQGRAADISPMGPISPIPAGKRDAADDRARPPVQPPGQPMAAEIVDDDRSQQEAIAGFAARQHWENRVRAWQQSSGPRRPNLLAAAVIIFVFLVMCRLEAGRFGPPIRPWMMFLTGLAAYGAYRLVRFVTLPSTPLAPPTPVRMAVPAAVPVPTAKVSRPVASKESALPAFVVKPPAVRAAELIGSLLVSAAVTAAMCVVMRLIEGYRGTLLEIEQCAWLYLVSLAGTWLVLIAAKFWEGSPGERMLRHFILMILGFGQGLAAFGLAELFMLRLPSKHNTDTAFYHDGRPTAMAYMAAFATLLAVLRWWVNADPLRNVRLGLWSVAAAVAFAYFVELLWQFPEPWLMMVAACMSVSVQLSSPWVPTHARLRPQRKRVV